MSQNWAIPSQSSPLPDPAIERLYDQGRFLDAWELVNGSAPLSTWSGVESRLLASRLTRQLGAPRDTLRLLAKLWREASTHPGVQFSYGIQFLEHRGAAALWLAMREWPAIEGGHESDRADLLTLKSRVASGMRDFSPAEAWLEEAERQAPQDRWVRLERVRCLSDQDRTEEALALADELCSHPAFQNYIPTIQVRAHLLQLSGNIQAASEALAAFAPRVQSAAVYSQLFGLLVAQKRWREAQDALNDVEQHSPLLEKAGRRWLAAQRALLNHRLGDRFQTLLLARQAGDPFHLRFAERIETLPAGELRRVELDVPFIRQDFKTCAPATFTALARFWGTPAEHQALVEELCYDGTPLWKQRDWAIEHGWVVREFWMTWKSAVDLLENGVPFALCTVDATSAHMQAVIGFDTARNTLIVRDPSLPDCVEYEAEPFLKRYEAFGPHACVFIPEAEASKIAALELPEEAPCDAAHAITAALSAFNRERAEEILKDMETRWPGHAVVWHSRLLVAAYDSDSGAQLECVDQLLQTYPGNAALQLRRLHSLREVHPDQVSSYLQSISGQSGTDPALLVEYGRTLVEDARLHPAAEQCLRRVLKRGVLNSGAVHALADVRWRQGRLEEATDLFRLAACLDGFQEALFQSWFLACKQTGHPQEALVQLADRFSRFSQRSSQPGLTLAWAHLQQEDLREADEVLKRAMLNRPLDGYLLLRAANLQGTLLRNPTEADRLLLQARGKVRELDWWQGAGALAEERLDTQEALRCYREAMSLEPTNLEAENGIARCLNQLEGPEAAIHHLHTVVARFPKHLGLKRLLAVWCRGTDTAQAEATLQSLIEQAPQDTWARRELALLCLQEQRGEEALTQAEEAVQHDPRNAANLTLLGQAQLRMHRPEEARQSWRKALSLDVDQSEAMSGLLSQAATDTARHEEIRQIAIELDRQVIRGDGLFAFAELCRSTGASKLLGEILEQAHRQRPDLWQTGSVRIHELYLQGQAAEALELAELATQRFPHLPRVWLDLAEVHRGLGAAEKERAAAEHAFEMYPGWSRAALALADALEREDALGAAQKILDRALVHSPKDPQLHVTKARLLWRLRSSEEALRSLETAIRIAPDHHWAWSLIHQWTLALGQPERVTRFARELTARAPGDAQLWLRLAGCLLAPEKAEEAIQTVDRAITINPRLHDAWDLKVQILAQTDRYQEAATVCDEGSRAVRSNAHLLGGRKAWVEAQAGQIQEAIARMQLILQDNHGYAWGWSQLAVWLTHLERYEEAERALHSLRNLQPRDPWVMRQLGIVALRKGDSIGAQGLFEKALKLEPTDSVSAECLFDLQLEAKELPKAETTLQHMSLHLPGANTTSRELLLRLSQADEKKVFGLLETLCGLSDPDPQPLFRSISAVVRTYGVTKPRSLLLRALKRSARNPHLGELLLLLEDPKLHPWKSLWRFARLPAGDLQRFAGGTLVRGLGEGGHRAPLKIALKFFRAVLRSDDQAWGQVGYACAWNHRYATAADWLADWQTRPGAQPWMVYNLCLALRQRNRYEEATDTARRGVDRWRHREGVDTLRLFLAFEAAVIGDVATAKADLPQLDLTKEPGYVKGLDLLTRTLIAVLESAPPERPKRFKELEAELSAHFDLASSLVALADTRRSLRRTKKALIKAGVGWPARRWFWSRLS